MFVWFSSGLVIMYAGPSALSAVEQLSGRELLEPASDWLTLGEVWRRSAAQRHQIIADKVTHEGPELADRIGQARLVQQASEPYWLVEDGAGNRFALSALNGNVHDTSPVEATLIAARWAANRTSVDSAASHELIAARFLDTGPQDSSMRNQQALRPFHRIAVGEGTRELLISARTGEVVRDSTRTQRVMYWVGNYLHLLRYLDTFKLGAIRNEVQTYLALFAFTGSLTGLIIGWQRWRPRWRGLRQYGNRQHPYRNVWNTWHFWTGLIGGTAALLWSFSGLVSSNPGDIITSATPSKAELLRYEGSTPTVMLDWSPDELSGIRAAKLVELSWRHVDSSAVLVGLTREGEKLPRLTDGVQHIEQASILRAIARLSGDTPVASSVLQYNYDSYYYPRHGQGPADKPLPVLKVDLSDKAATRFYIDPQDGRVLSRQDRSRRVYRWLYSALHHWDFGVFYQRPLWDVWMLIWVPMGIVLGGSAMVLGYRRLRLTADNAKARAAYARKTQLAADATTQASVIGTSQPQ